MNLLVYIRNTTETVLIHMQRPTVKKTKALRFGELLKLGIAPGGGGPAGPSKSAWY